ncbi:MAG: Fic family protein [Gemmatimonadota bacterium]|nr:Fic family protein [Gemmatimonadota bacterium]
MSAKTEHRDRHRAGRFITQQTGSGGYAAFIPSALPPRPALDMSPPLQRALERASTALGRLDGITLLLPAPDLFIYMYVRKEAVLSSQIEGTQSSFSDLLLFETGPATGHSSADVVQVSNYLAAMQHGLKRLEGGFPISLRLLREIHGVLVRGTRGGNKTPGEFRTSQNWIGGSRPGNALYVPPPPHEVLPALSALERFIQDDADEFPLLIKAGLAHAQFETIHPFLDGNGRIGRLLITFLLCAGGALSQPLLYLSLYLKRNREAYYASLQRVRTEGDWEGWVLFYLTGVEEVAGQATETARRIMHLFEKDRRSLQRLGRSANTALRVHELMKSRAIATIGDIAHALDVSFPTASAAVGRLSKQGILREITGRQRDQHFAYQQYLNILSEGTEPIPDPASP